MKWSVKGNGYETGSYVDEFGTGDHNFCRFLAYLKYLLSKNLLSKKESKWDKASEPVVLQTV